MVVVQSSSTALCAAACCAALHSYVVLHNSECDAVVPVLDCIVLWPSVKSARCGGCCSLNLVHLSVISCLLCQGRFQDCLPLSDRCYCGGCTGVGAGKRGNPSKDGCYSAFINRVRGQPAHCLDNESSGEAFQGQVRGRETDSGLDLI